MTVCGMWHAGTTWYVIIMAAVLEWWAHKGTTQLYLHTYSITCERHPQPYY